MKYLLMLIGPEYDFATMPEAKIEADMAAHTAFVALLEERGIPWSGEALHDGGSATTLRPGPAGEVIVTDGPYADLKEQLGGYYLIEVKDLDEALEIAKKCPLDEGAVEVRPVYDTD